MILINGLYRLLSRRTQNYLVCLISLQCALCHSQVKIISTSFSAFNVSAESMCHVNLSNTGGEGSCFIESIITNIQGREIIRIVTNPFKLKPGFTNSSQLSLTISRSHFLDNSVSEFVRMHRQLPSGKYNYCVQVKSADGSLDDELCENIESESSTILYLVNPGDGDSIENLNPILLWQHNEFFNLTQQGEFYKLVVAEIRNDQTLAGAVEVNNPLFSKSFLNRHDVQYPFDAPALIPGKNYAWQVQKVTNGAITNRTEAWKFTVKIDRSTLPVFVEITPKLNVNPYNVVNNKIYFIYKDEYLANASQLNILIECQNGKVNTAIASPSIQKVEGEELVVPDRYEVDLKQTELSEGMHTLIITNLKDQKSVLRFHYKYE